MTSKKSRSLREKFEHFFYYSPAEKYRVVRTIICLPFGIAFGVLFWFVLFSGNKKLSDNLKEKMQFLVIGSFAVWFSLSVQARCSTCIMIPTFLGNQGGAVAKVYLVSYLIMGPLNNIKINSRELNSKTICNIKLGVEYAKQKAELFLRPFIKHIKGFKKSAQSAKQLKHVNEKMTDTFLKKFNEIDKLQGYEMPPGFKKKIDEINKAREDEEVEASKTRSSKSKEESIRQRSQKAYDQFRRNLKNRLSLGCNEVYASVYAKCTQSLDAGKNPLCEKNAKKLGNKGSVTAGIMDAVFTLKLANWGSSCESYVSSGKKEICSQYDSKASESQECKDQAAEQAKALTELDQPMKEMVISSSQLSEDLDVEVKIELPKTKKPKVNAITLADVKLTMDVNIYTKFDSYQDFIQHLTQFFFFLLVLNGFRKAYNYVHSYNENIRFDNLYMTSYFYQIDAKRKEEGKLSFLPAYKHELKTLIIDDPKAKTDIGQKKLYVTNAFKAVLPKVADIVVFTLVTAVLFGIDATIITLLKEIQKYGHVVVEHSGSHKVVSRVKGDGFMADLVRTVWVAMNENAKLNKTTFSNIDCQIHIRYVEQTVIHWIIGLHCFFLVTLIYAAASANMRFRVASFFFRKRQKTRIIWLYNECLKKRANLLLYSKLKLKEQAKASKLVREVGFLERIATKYPTKFGCFKRFVKATCLLCGDPGKPEEMESCSNDVCKSQFCTSCWVYLDRKCWACRARKEADSGDSSSSSSGSGSSTSVSKYQVMDRKKVFEKNQKPKLKKLKKHDEV